MSTRKLSAGDIIDARCTRCRAVLNHRIIAMVGERVVRVECNTCGGAHNYHPPEKTKATAAGAASRKEATAPRPTRKDHGAADRTEWATLRPTMNTERALAYDMDGSYRLNSLVEHPTFGLGVVKRLIAPNKMEVLFEEGRKLLRCK